MTKLFVAIADSEAEIDDKCYFGLRNCLQNLALNGFEPCYCFTVFVAFEYDSLEAYQFNCGLS